MKFSLQNNVLTVMSESKIEALAIVDHYRILRDVAGRTEEELDANLAKASAALAAAATGHLSYEDKGTDKRPWFACEADLGPTSIAPYTSLLHKLTGFTGEVPELPFQYCWHGLLHTHVVTECGFSSNGIVARGFIRAEDWNGQPAEVRAAVNFRDYVVEMFGFREHEPEFIQNGGFIQRNPHYLRRHAAEPGLGCPDLWKAMFAWWRATHASPAQEEVLRKAEATCLAGGLGDNSWDVRKGGQSEAGLVDYAGIRVSYQDSPGLVTWDEFIAMGTGLSPVGAED